MNTASRLPLLIYKLDLKLGRDPGGQAEKGAGELLLHFWLRCRRDDGTFCFPLSFTRQVNNLGWDHSHAQNSRSLFDGRCSCGGLGFVPSCFGSTNGPITSGEPDKPRGSSRHRLSSLVSPPRLWVSLLSALLSTLRLLPAVSLLPALPLLLSAGSELLVRLLEEGATNRSPGRYPALGGLCECASKECAFLNAATTPTQTHIGGHAKQPSR
jgi:hypothetical protein